MKAQIDFVIKIHVIHFNNIINPGLAIRKMDNRKQKINKTFLHIFSAFENIFHYIQQTHSL